MSGAFISRATRTNSLALSFFSLLSFALSLPFISPPRSTATCTLLSGHLGWSQRKKERHSFAAHPKTHIPTSPSIPHFLTENRLLECKGTILDALSLHR
ncbi:MAG: hypothetical protein BYD32DRAFT_412811 [Podila humilis]|nr:MAG: hypothetical protein BYD32DRAFT_412811 [Podila humilis]